MDFLKRALAASLSVILSAPASYAASALPIASVQPSLAMIGVAAAVRGSVRAETPGQAVGREIGSGRPLYLNDHIVTGPDGRLQILLLDQTTFTVGPDSDMVLDKFVYDPSTNAGKLSARLVKGVFRFVTGKIAKHRADDVSIALPTGTIGIRGTIVFALVGPQFSTVGLGGPGRFNNVPNEPAGWVTVSNPFGSRDIRQVGFATSVPLNGAPTVPIRVTLGALPGIAKLDAPMHSSSGSSASNSTESSNRTSSSGSSGSSTGASASSSPSATESSGQSKASGVSTASTIYTSISGAMTQAESTAAQQISKIITVIDAGNQGLEADGLTTWDQLVRFQQGAGHYSGAGYYAVGGNVTSLNTFGFNIAVDFTHQQVGGLLANGQPSQIFSTGGQLNGAVTVGQVPITSTIVDLTNGLSGVSASGITQAHIGFHNSGGTVAGAAVVTIMGVSQGQVVSGIGSGTLFKP